MKGHLVVCAFVATTGLPGLACGGSAAGSSTPSASSTTAAAPVSPAVRLAAADAALRASLRAWRAADPTLRTPPPSAALVAAATERAIVHRLTQRPALAGEMLSALPAGPAAAIRTDLIAVRDLRPLTGPPRTRLRLVPPAPAGDLLADYRAAQRRFGVRWQVLAAVNLVESAFGRVSNRSSAGAQGPMQFLPATWRAYGLGGDVRAPRDAILGAANYLHQSGAPADDRRALHAYNPSSRYVDAVLAYARAMTADPVAYLVYYTWEASLPPSPGR